jgi:glycosyltransferase involved in cell wall biosynthesis
MPQISADLPFSVYIRTLNEQRCLGQVLEAVQGLTSDLVVVDSGSTDRTLEIAQEHGARVISQKWLGAGMQKRVGEDACRHDWVLDLDADEIVSEELANEIRQLFASGPPTCPIFQLKQTQVFISGYRNPRLGTRRRSKLYNRKQIRIPDHIAWDQFHIPKGMPHQVLNGPLWHYGYEGFGQLAIKQTGWMRKQALGMQRLSRPALTMRLLFGFPSQFIKKFFVQGYWRAGMEGLIMAAICAFSTWIKYAMLYERDFIPSGSQQQQQQQQQQAATCPSVDQKAA